MKDFAKYNKKAVFSEIGEYCHLSGEHSFIEISQWANLEGFDININDKLGNRTIPITYGQYKLIKKLVKFLDKQENETTKTNN